MIWNSGWKLIHLLIKNGCWKLIQLLIQNVGREHVPCWFKMSAKSTSCVDSKCRPRARPVLIQNGGCEHMPRVDSTPSLSANAICYFKWLLSVLDVFLFKMATESNAACWFKMAAKREHATCWYIRVKTIFKSDRKSVGRLGSKAIENTCFRRGCWPERRRAGAHLPSIWMMIISGKY